MYAVAAANSTVCSMSLSVSRAAVTLDSAARTLFAVISPLKSVCETVAPTERGVVGPLTVAVTLCVKGVPGNGGMVSCSRLRSLPMLAFAEIEGR
jgi:hypothetical protein